MSLVAVIQNHEGQSLFRLDYVNTCVCACVCECFLVLVCLPPYLSTWFIRSRHRCHETGHESDYFLKHLEVIICLSSETLCLSSLCRP